MTDPRQPSSNRHRTQQPYGVVLISDTLIARASPAKTLSIGSFSTEPRMFSGPHAAWYIGVIVAVVVEVTVVEVVV
jgi:hypothetical protein